MSTKTTQPDRGFLPALTGIRAAAALWVLLGHYSSFLINYFHFPSDSPLQPFFDSPYAGVDLFFVLSGFIMSYTYSGALLKRGIGIAPDFWWKRIARIYPVYLLATVAAAAMFALAALTGYEFKNDEGAKLNSATLTTNLLGIQTWVNLPSLDGPAWSVSSELFAYALFPFLAVVMLRIWNKIFLSALAIICTASLGYIGQSTFVPPRIWQVFFEFIIGMIVYQLSARAVAVPKLFTTGWFRGAIWSTALAIIYLTGRNSIESHVALAPVAAIIVWSYSLNSGKPSLLDSRIMVRLGLWSYSLYLVHRLIQNAAAGLHLRSTNIAYLDGLIFVGLIAAAILSAAALYHFVEEPARKYLNRRPYFRRPARPPIGRA